jgi:hypothetical protein
MDHIHNFNLDFILAMLWAKLDSPATIEIMMDSELTIVLLNFCPSEL